MSFLHCEPHIACIGAESASTPPIADSVRADSRLRSNTGRTISSGRTGASAATWPLILVMLFATELCGQNSYSSGRTTPGPATSDIYQRLLATEMKAKDPPVLSVDAIVGRLMTSNARRSAELRGFQSMRWYHLQYHGLFGARDASMQVLATYNSPDHRSYSVVSESGSKLLLNRVLLKLLDSEREAFQNRKQVELSPDNYQFDLVDTDLGPDGNACYVLAVKPRKENKFLYHGKIWVDANDFAVVHMEGQPAKSPSFWVRDTEIKSNWERVGNFWFIQHNESVSHIRMGGMATLNIDYGDYQITGGDRGSARTQGQTPILPDPASVTPQH
jgi:hypothetical protein